MELSIELTQRTYQRIKEMATARDLTVEEFLAVELEAGRLEQDRAFKGYVISELEGLVSKIKGLEPEGGKKSLGLRAYSYQRFKDQVPESVERLKNLYEKKGWFHQAYFYLLMEGNRIVGYLGLSPHEESLPYGAYLYIYQLYLEPGHVNPPSLQRLKGQLEELAKSHGASSLDISMPSTNLNEEQLGLLGFLPYEANQQLRLRGRWKGRQLIPLEELSSDQWDQLKGLLLVGRAYPLDYYLNQWQQEEKKRQLWLAGGIEGLMVIRSSPVAGKGKMTEQLYCFTDAQRLFDSEALLELLKGMGKELIEESDQGLTLMLPQGMESAFAGMEWELLRQIPWYRKMTY